MCIACDDSDYRRRQEIAQQEAVEEMLAFERELDDYLEARFEEQTDLDHMGDAEY